jgi:hypothetical protein
MSGGESHIYSETPYSETSNDRSHIDKSRHANTPNIMPTDKSKHVAMPTVAFMYTDGVKPPPPPEPPPGEPPPVFNIFDFKAADHIVICAINAFENDHLDEPSWTYYLIHIAKWETKFTCVINKEILRSYKTAPGFTVPKTYGKIFHLCKRAGITLWGDSTTQELIQIADLAITIKDPKDFRKHKSKSKGLVLSSFT